ncbi:hypothetical protein SADUNF_Sadunf18G0061900 [Salix dunnii]|uniref:OVATE domain-containing protein n=1 Tax=Salix dunnii TaxID=1413687 RepID=A0A835J3Q9_9ROSI|nr:hypothetical protein SADUNF_Sadunf18G0061900 [Salix dunnii]
MTPSMLLGNSLCTTKKFFQKTVQRFKSFFSGDPYQKIPKPPARNNPHNSSFAVGIDMRAQTNKDSANLYRGFTGRWDDTGKEKSKRDMKRTATAPSSSSAKQERDHDLNSGFMNLSKATAVKNYQFLRRRDQDYTHDDPNNENKRSYARKRSPLDDNSGSKNITCEGRSFLVAQKLKELEMMDVSNVEHVLDIEEVLHYYSRLTCPAYLDIVDKFFMDMYAEFIAPPANPRSVNSRPRLRSVR